MSMERAKNNPIIRSILKYKDDYLFTNNSGNGFGCSITDDKDEFVIKDKKDNEKK